MLSHINLCCTPVVPCAGVNTAKWVLPLLEQRSAAKVDAAQPIAAPGLRCPAAAALERQSNCWFKPAWTYLHFAVDPDAGRVVVEVVDRMNGIVIKSIPSEKMVQIIKSVKAYQDKEQSQEAIVKSIRLPNTDMILQPMPASGVLA